MTKQINDNPRHYHWQDKVIINTLQFIRNAFDLPQTTERPLRVNPAQSQPAPQLSEEERKLSAACMRINHTGEVCAQALYLGQSLTARNQSIQETLTKAAQEEYEHLMWCQERLKELQSHTSLLNPLWYTGSFVIGAIAGIAGDQWSLGFLAETENQVSQHLEGHLAKLPTQDLKSRAIVTTMQIDEQKHATTALSFGAQTLPFPIQLSMRALAKVMTTLTYYV